MDFAKEKAVMGNGEKLSVRTLKRFCLTVSRIVWKIEYEGTENIPTDPNQGFVIASNHQTYIDPVWIGIPIKRDLRFLAWDEALHWPVIGSIMRWLGSLPVNTYTGRNPESLKKAIGYLQNGSALMIFPEGAREFEDGLPLEFKPGAVLLAEEASVPILPVTLSGGNKVWARGSKWPRRGKIKVRFHPMLEIPLMTDGDRKVELRKATETLRRIITGLE